MPFYTAGIGALTFYRCIPKMNDHLFLKVLSNVSFTLGSFIGPNVKGDVLDTVGKG